MKGLYSTDITKSRECPERDTRARRMIRQMDSEGFGNCSNHAECEAVCPKEISIANIAKLRREFWRAMF
jgi:succinate dehydrogenase / fumarate reductase iron-sulfur subunit